MTIYALFLCLQATGACEMAEHGRMTFAGYMPAHVYSTVEDCEATARQVSHRIKPTQDGRFVLLTNSALWYECRSHHEETWEPTR